MLEFFTTIPGIVISLGAILAVVVTGLLYALGLWKKGKDGEDDRLIKILEGTVNALEQKVDNQKKEHDETVGMLTKKIDTLTDKVDHLEKENETLTKVLQGRDDATQTFYEQAFQAIDKTNNIFNMVKLQGENQTLLIKLLSKHLGVDINNGKH